MFYEVWLPNKVEVGAGIIKKLGEQLKERKVFVVTYKSGIRSSAIVKKLTDILDVNEISYVLYKGIKPDPDIQCIDDGVKLCRQENCDLVLGIGGGSTLDAAKCIALMVNNQGSVREYQMGLKSFTEKSLPVYAVPTTSGTGSEATKVAVISNAEAGVKRSLAHPYMIPEYALIDPELSISLPKELTYSTGLDALSHAVESFCSLNANPVTEAFSLKAMELIINNLEIAVKCPENLEARENMAVGSFLGGVALNAGVGAVHILAQPLGAVYGVSHGNACAILLPVVMKMNYKYCIDKFIKMAAAMNLNITDCCGETAAAMVIERIEKLYTELGIPSKLSMVCSVRENSIKDVLNSMNNSTGHIRTNPRPVDEKLLTEILELVI